MTPRTKRIRRSPADARAAVLEAARARLLVERRAGFDVVRDVGDRDDHAEATIRQCLCEERVVVITRSSVVTPNTAPSGNSPGVLYGVGT